MSIVKRVGFYLIGFSIGVALLAYFFREKRAEFCYFPNCRVLKEIRTKELEFSKSYTNDSTYTVKEIKESILKNGEVDFGKSKVHTTPCKTYIIEGIIRKNKVTLDVELCPKTSIITSIRN